MLGTIQFVAVLCSALFAGAAIYINLVEHPARMGCGTELAVTEWAPSYRRATAMQVPLAVVSTVAGLVAWLTTGRILWLLGAILIFAVIPFTLVVIMPTNKLLLDPRPAQEMGQTSRRAELAQPPRLMHFPDPHPSILTLLRPPRLAPE